MKIEDSHKRQNDLDELLLELSIAPIDEVSIDGIVLKLKKIYSDGFRHSYSRFFPLIVEIFKEDNNYNQDYLSGNLEQIRLVVEQDYFDSEDKEKCKYVGLYKPLMKLTDHINLEIGRYSQSCVYESKIQDLEKRSQAVQEQIDNSKKELRKVNRKLQSAQKEYVAILGIFSSVVLTFTGGIAFSTSVLENFHKASIYRSSFICLIIALVLSTTLYVLFKSIEKIVHEPESKSEKQCLFEKHFPIIITDAIIILVMVGIIICWVCGAVEKRDKRIGEQNIIQTEIENTAEINNNNIVPNQIQPESEEITNSDATTDDKTSIQFETKEIETGDTNVENTNPVSPN